MAFLVTFNPDTSPHLRFSFCRGDFASLEDFMIDTKVMDYAGGFCARNAESRSMPVSEDNRVEGGDVCRRVLSYEQRGEIISAYLEVLDVLGTPIGLESDLPYSKEDIRLAIFQELVQDPTSEFRERLEIAYIQLEIFIPYDDFKIIADFKYASIQAQKMADTGDPSSVIRSAGIMKKAKGDRVVKIQESIYEKMRERSAQIRGIGVSARVMNHVIENPGQTCF
jgi:hypothetical protein